MSRTLLDYIPLKIHGTIFVIDLFSRSFIVIVTKSGNIHHPVVQVSFAEHVGRKLLLYCCRSICNVPIFSYLECFLWIIEHMHTIQTILLSNRNGTFLDLIFSTNERMHVTANLESFECSLTYQLYCFPSTWQPLIWTDRVGKIDNLELLSLTSIDRDEFITSTTTL